MSSEKLESSSSIILFKRRAVGHAEHGYVLRKLLDTKVIAACDAFEACRVKYDFERYLTSGAK